MRGLEDRREALEVVFVGGGKKRSSSKICSSLDIGGTSGDRGCLPKCAARDYVQAPTLATTIVHRGGLDGGLKGMGDSRIAG